ncbi:hypothetical protein AMATHDRAFT_144633 [Amanita thiersii Skay4041]|uniref:Voltage-gated hydrogen channel 1 n=1 Tax=Amanita thiersii Skay4041 TaxID=703135 RepID=A0A2A9NSL4_9AGAR|nr:hypothetical protein AMATHDRAFT_144633 [Amanita thiersii Skay4041]
MPIITDQYHESSTEDSPNTWKRATADLLERPFLHKAVITLISIDVACVVIDLGYILLSPGCNPQSPQGQKFLQALSHISLAITTLFLIEIPLTIWALGFSYYNPRSETPFASLHLFDALIIVITFALEMILRGSERELAGLLIVLRLWRIVKLVEGVAVGTRELSEEELNELIETRKELEEVRIELHAVRVENMGLRHRLARLEDHDAYV